MRTLLKDILTPEDIEFFLGVPNTSPKQDLDHPRVHRLHKLIEAETGETLSQGYWRTEKKPDGHPWHYDGCTLDLEPNHMAWCRYSCSILLTDPNDFTGGVLELTDPDESFKDNMQGSGVLFSSAADNDPVLHRATPSRGHRAVLLIFLGS